MNCLSDTVCSIQRELLQY